ncbi:MAG TPA: trypsin-like peptidase domain-containing protein [Jatrophihabitans sp.]|nr:trypsin-like peptidase domain-containing protein [Jatrophihabitans sp.]
MTPSDPSEPAGASNPQDPQHTEQYPVAHDQPASYQYTPYDQAHYANRHYRPQQSFEGAPPVPTPEPSLRKYRIALGVTAGVAAVALVVSGVSIANNRSLTITGSGSEQQVLPNGGESSGGSGNSGSGNSGSGNSGNGNSGSGNSGGGTFPYPFPGGGTGSGGTSASGIGLATAKQKVGVVTIVSVLGYQNAEGAGTGMILNSKGEILTNNHVVNGATSITVTVVSTGKSYRAQVVGTDPSDDVAVIQLRNASGLKTAKIGDSSDVSVGDSIVGVGNAGGTGTLRASNGKVTALNQTITASDESGANAERLHGLIGVNAPIVAGDSGGPMYDSAGEIIGMNTAASQNETGTAASAYAIPIDNALNIADKIESGKASSTIHIGLPGFLGVGVDDANGAGVAITSVVPDGPADRAGITAGSVVTAVNGKAVNSPTALKSALSGHKANSKVKISWTDLNGAAHSATVTLIAGPAD